MKYKSFRGKTVDMEELRLSHEKTIAAGNMNTNAKGDRLGAGGEIVETAQAISRRHYSTTATSTKTGVSIKNDKPAAEVFPDDTPAAKKPAAKKKPVKKKAPAKQTEVEMPDGNIMVVDDEGETE